MVAPLYHASGSRRRGVEVEVTFDEPGTYELRAIAGDGALTTSESLTITVTR